MSAEALLSLCREKGLSVACAESCTGGMLAALLTEPPGASAMFEAGIVTYSNTAKQDLLGVSPDSLTAFGAVSPEVAAEMAFGLFTRTGADLCLSITGIAGPGGSNVKPEGRVCFALVCHGRETRRETIEFGALGRARVRIAARDHALDLLLAAAQL